MNDHLIYVEYGSDAKAMAGRLLEASGMESRVRPGMRIVLKPNLVVAKPAALGATTSPEMAAGVLEWLLENGIAPKDICIAEGSWLGEDTQRAFQACGYGALSKKYGVQLVDLKRDPAERLTLDGFSLEVCRTALEADLLINLPVLKAHCQTLLTCALKNLKGCIPDSEKRRYHTLGIHKPVAHLAKALRPGLTIVDGLCGDLTFEEGGSPVVANRMLLCADPVKLDAFAATLIGLSAKDVDYIGMAARLGVGTDAVEPEDVVYLSEPQAAQTAQAAGPVGGHVRRLTRDVDARDACSACFGSLVHALHRLSEDGQRFEGKICIGQGFRGTSMNGVGIGTCCRGLSESVAGCPPTAAEILGFLEGRG